VIFFVFKVLQIEMHKHELGFPLCCSDILTSCKQIWIPLWYFFYLCI